MPITEILAKNAELYGDEISLVEVNPGADKKMTWREFALTQSVGTNYRREITWKEFNDTANRFANLLISKGVKKRTKVAILLMNCIEWLPIYFGILRAGAIAVPLNYRYASDEIKYCLEKADAEYLVFGPEFIGRVEAIYDMLKGVMLVTVVLPLPKATMKLFHISVSKIRIFR